jgi:hypothetical protein
MGNKKNNLKDQVGRGNLLIVNSTHFRPIANKLGPTTLIKKPSLEYNSSRTTFFPGTKNYPITKKEKSFIFEWNLTNHISN